MTSATQDITEFLLGLDFLRTRDHLLFLFKLCCVSASTPSPIYPDITLGGITTAGHQSRFTDVILPCRSYVARVSGSVTLCSDDSNLGLDFLRTRDHLLYLFKLCRLSASTPSPIYPDITLWGITTAGHQSRFTDVILPCRSYVA